MSGAARWRRIPVRRPTAPNAADAAVAAFAEAVARELRAGSALVEALASARARAGDVDDPRLWVLIALGREVGGELADAFDEVSAAARDDVEVRDEVRALTAQSRASAWLLTALPLLSTAGLAAVHPDALRVLVTQRVGWACLAGAATALAVGWAWTTALVRSV